MDRRKFLKTTSAAALTAVASTSVAAADSPDAGTYDDCEECWNSGGGYNECCGPFGPCTDCAMK